MHETEVGKQPDCQYYNRKTSVERDLEIQRIITACHEKLRPIIAMFLPNLDPKNNRQVEARINALKKRMAAAKGRPVEQALVQMQLAILEDLNKINKLTKISIPQENSSPLSYYSLAESAGGVTEKVSLIQEKKVIEQLGKLQQAKLSNLGDYIKQRNGFKLPIQAILKLPKKGKILEVQREVMALNFARILGLETTPANMVEHQGKPAVFVPFDDIRLLKEVATGKTMRARLFSTAKYQHYSTLNPVGAGVQAEGIIEDLGKHLGLFYLCSDTDAIGGYNQNKALKGNRLFVFDQVFMGQKKLGLDSRLSMQPITLFSRHTRHDQGRNRTLIEDSAMSEKFNALMNLKAQQDKLEQYCDQVVRFHVLEIQRLRRQHKEATTKKERVGLNAKIKEVDVLLRDGRAMRVEIHQRIRDIDRIMPKRGEGVAEEMLLPTLILEKLCNKPRLFTVAGRPYRNPWTQRHANRVLSIDKAPGSEEYVQIRFSGRVPDNIIAMLKKHGAESLIKISSSRLRIKASELHALRETSLFPEQEGFDTKKTYLDVRDLAVIQKQYGQGHRDRIIKQMHNYVQHMTRPHSLEEQLNYMKATEATLKCYVDGIGVKPPKDKGFGMHVLKKFHFDVQQRLQGMMVNPPVRLQEAFNAALTLDRVAEFNAVVAEAVRYDQLDHPVFLNFLQNCINAKNPNDHFSALALSKKMQEEANALRTALPRLMRPSAFKNLFNGGHTDTDTSSLTTAPAVEVQPMPSPLLDEPDDLSGNDSEWVPVTAPRK